MKNWIARRSGGRITVTGQNDEGSEEKIANIDTIKPHPTGRFLIAMDKHGCSHTLELTA